MKHLYLLMLAILFITGCTFQHMDQGLTHLQGKNIRQAIEVLGYPDNERVVAGDKIYEWSKSHIVSGIAPVTQSTSGYFGGAYGSATTTSYVPTTDEYHCKLRLIVDKKDTVVKSEYSGNPGGCQGYSRRLYEYSQSLMSEKELKAQAASLE